jgi:hypothetical protein
VAPAVTQFIVNDGSPQRSMVRSLTVVFNQPVTLASGSILLSLSGGASYGVTASNPSGDERTWLLGFFGPNTIGSSLPDGSYTLTIPAAAVTNALGQNLGARYVAQFHRLFGDIDGDRDVDNKDHDAFKKAYDTKQFAAGYVSAFDFNNDGSIDKTDRSEFQSRMGHQLSSTISAPAVGLSQPQTSSTSNILPSRPAVRTHSLAADLFSSVTITEAYAELLDSANARH